MSSLDQVTLLNPLTCQELFFAIFFLVETFIVMIEVMVLDYSPEITDPYHFLWVGRKIYALRGKLFVC